MSFIDIDTDDYSQAVQFGLVNIRLECNPEPRDREGIDWDSASSRQSTPDIHYERSPTPTDLELAKRYADHCRGYLIRFPAGGAMLKAEDHGESATDPEYWWEKARYYFVEYQKLCYEAMEHRKRKRQEGIKSPPRASGPITRARQLAVTRELPTTSSAVRGGENADESQCAASSPSLYKTTNSSNEGTPRRSTMRRRKHQYRLRDAGMMGTGDSMVQTVSNGYATPTSNKPRPGRSVSEGNRKGSARRRHHRDADRVPGQAQKKPEPRPHLSSHRVEKSFPRTRQHSKRHRQVANSRSRLTTQPIEPISSRLRSSKCLLFEALV